MSDPDLPRATLERFLAPEVLHALDRYIAEAIDAGAARTDFADGKLWVTTAEAAELLDCTPRAVRARIKRGWLEARYQGSRLYVSTASILDPRGYSADAKRRKPVTRRTPRR